MNNSLPTPSPGSSNTAAPQDNGFSPWQRLKSKRISYLTLPLLFMATVTEFVILATGWKYQQVVCLPQGMGVTFFGIGPIGATILAVELLKLPLAIWTASRHGWQKGFMLCIGLPLICVLTFQLVKDMAVYEMGVALNPATQMLEKATTEETKIAQLNGELSAIEAKKADREKKLADLAAKEAKAKADLDESLKHNEDVRHDAISLTDYQKKELADVDNKESAIIGQFNADSAQINKTLADLRANREVEVGRASKWNAEEARIENAYKAKLSDYQNQKAAYDKAMADYENASFIRRKLMKEPVSPGVPPVREENTQLKPTALADIDTQISAKEAELTAVANKRRDRIAQVEAETHQLREEYDKRSVTKREEADKKRDELAASQVALAAEWKDERKQIDAELATAVQKVDGIRAELAVAQKNAEGYYEAREADIRKTQVHRIATTVEIVRGLIKGERPMSIKMTAKERGDILTDQISMVRIWVYPVLAFIVAFLPTLMVEIGFSTVFEPEQAGRLHRFGFFGRQLHAVCVRAGRQKILGAERMTKDALMQVSARDKALASQKAASEKALQEKDSELQAGREAIAASTAQLEEQLQQNEAQFAEQSKAKEAEWVVKLANMADALNRTVVEKDALRDQQRTEIERQVQMRQKVWSDRVTQLRQELEEQRATYDAERTTMLEEHQKRVNTSSEDGKNQIFQLRRQLADAEAAATEKASRLALELKEVSRARDAAETQLKHQSDTLALKLAQVEENAARELEKATREEKNRLGWQELEFEKKLRVREEALEQQLKKKEQDLVFAFDAKLAEERTRIEESARLREAENTRQLSARTQETDASWTQEIKKREDAAQAKLKQREQQLQAQTEARLKEAQAQAEEHLHQRQADFEQKLEAQSRAADTRLKEELQKKEVQFQARLKEREQDWTAKAAARTQVEEQLRQRQSEFEHQLEAQSRGADSRLKEELQKKEAQFQTKLKEREQEWAAKAAARAAEKEKEWAAELSEQEADWKRDAETRVAAIESRLAEAKHKEEQFQSKLRQRDQQWESKMNDAKAEFEAQAEEAVRRRGVEADNALRALETQYHEELQQQEVAAQTRAKQREQEVIAQVKTLWEAEAEAKVFAAMESFRALLARTEMERDEARQSAQEGIRRVENLEKKLTEASSFFSSWRNGNSVTEQT